MVARTVILLLCLTALSHSAKILGVFQFPSKSHHILGSALLKELASRGHEVTMISPFPLKSPPRNYKDVHLDGVLEQKEEEMKTYLNPNATFFQRMHSGINTIRLMSRAVLENGNMQTFLQSGQKFDLVINLMMLSEALLGIGHKVNATTIGFSVIGSSELTNQYTSNPAPYSYVPNAFLSYTDEMNFIQRYINTLASAVSILALTFINMPYQQSLLTEFFPDAPPLTDLIENVDLTLINSHYSTETPRPYLPNLIQIGGFHLEEKQQLPDDLQKYLDISTNGVIYFSLGTNIKSVDIPQEKLKAILETFRNSNYNILWKFENDDLINKPKNVRIANWLPQKAVLAHKNVIAFITHGGLGSTVESVYYGVPMVCIPFFGDQSKNTADSVKNGYGVELNWVNLNEDSFSAAIKEVTENKFYRERVELRSDLYRNQEISPMKKAVFWVEHVLKHGHAKHLKSRAHLIPWYQYMLVDVLAFVATIILILFGVFYFIIKMFVYVCCGRKKSKKVKKQKQT